MKLRLPKGSSVEWTSSHIRERVLVIANYFNSLYADRDKPNDPVHCIIVLKGAFFFAADLIHHFDFPVVQHFVIASSYGKSQTSSGTVTLQEESLATVKGHDVLIIDDIFDTGLTMAAVTRSVRVWNPHSVRATVLVNKQYRKTKMTSELTLEYGFQARADRFFFGYGMDLQETHRMLPDVWSISKEPLHE